MEVGKVTYCLHIQNPHNLLEFDDYESDAPFARFSVGDIVARQTFYWGAGGPEKVPMDRPEGRVVGVRRSFSVMMSEDGEPNGASYDETWVITDAEWLEHHYPEGRG